MKIYIARKFVYTNNHSSISLYEEGAYSTFEKAKNFIDSQLEKSPNFMFEIISYNLDDKEPWESMHNQYFNFNGEPFEQKAETVADGHFHVGDIILIKAFPWDQESPVTKNVIGVIIARPSLLENESEIDHGYHASKEDYTVYFIDEKGYLDHEHCVESCLVKYLEALPEDLEFLAVLSDYLATGKGINEDVLRKIIKGEIQVIKRIGNNYWG